MGSEGPKKITIHVTGFKKFQGVPINPTEIIVNNLRDYVEKKGFPAGVTLGSCTILEVAGDDALPQLYQTMESVVSKTDTESNANLVWVSLFSLVQFVDIVWIDLFELIYQYEIVLEIL